MRILCSWIFNNNTTVFLHITQLYEEKFKTFSIPPHITQLYDEKFKTFSTLIG